MRAVHTVLFFKNESCCLDAGKTAEEQENLRLALKDRMTGGGVTPPLLATDHPCSSSFSRSSIYYKPHSFQSHRQISLSLDLRRRQRADEGPDRTSGHSAGRWVDKALA